MHVRNGWEPEPACGSVGSQVEAPSTGMLGLIAMTVAAAAVAMGLLIGAAEAGWLPSVADEAAQVFLAP